VIENLGFPGRLRKAFWKPATLWLVFVFSCGVFSDMEMFFREEGGFEDYEKKIIREMYFYDFRFNNDLLQRVAFFPISAGGKRFSPAKSSCLSGRNVEL
jgi:hypothetical protein